MQTFAIKSFAEFFAQAEKKVDKFSSKDKQRGHHRAAYLILDAV